MNVAIPPESNFPLAVINNYDQESVANEQDVEHLLHIVTAEKKFSDLRLPLSEIKAALPSLPFHVKDAIFTIYNLWCKKYDSKAEAIGVKKNFIPYHDRLSAWFPKSKVIWIIRDGRGVFNSKYNHIMSSTNQPFSNSVRQAASEWAQRNRMLEKISNTCPTMKVRYEYMLQDMPSVLSELSAALGLPLLDEPRSEAQYEVPERYGKTLHKNIGSKPLAKKATSWKNELPRNLISRYEFFAGRELLHHGYAMEKQYSSLRLTIGDFSRKICEKFLK